LRTIRSTPAALKSAICPSAASITCSVTVRIEGDVPLEQAIDAALGQIADFSAAGVDLIVLNLPLDAPPDVLRPLAEAVAPLA
jgi:hypothetical protein